MKRTSDIYVYSDRLFHLFSDDNTPITLDQVLLFGSGTDRVPIGGIHSGFLFFDLDPNKLPTARTCTLEITVPVPHQREIFQAWRGRVAEAMLNGMDMFGQV